MLKFICRRMAALSAGYAASLENRMVQTTYTFSQSSFIITVFKEKSTPPTALMFFTSVHG